MVDYSQSEQVITDVLGPRVTPVGEAEAKEVHISVATSDVMHELTEILYEQIELSYWNGDLPFDKDELHAVAEFLIAARCAYVFGVRGDRHPRDVEYPSMFGPVLATIGRYRDDAANMVLVPAPAAFMGQDPNDEDKLVEKKKGTRVQAPACYDKVIRAMRTLGVPTSFGLPMDKDVDTDDFFRVEVTNEVLRGKDAQAPSPVTLFSRALVNMTYLENIFGNARVTYATLGSMRIGLREIVARNVDGMRGR